MMNELDKFVLLVFAIRFASGGVGGWAGVQDKLYCQLYDETVVDLLEDDRQRDTNIHHRLQRHWLGSLQIPFSSLCTNPRVRLINRLVATLGWAYLNQSKSRIF